MEFTVDHLTFGKNEAVSEMLTPKSILRLATPPYFFQPLQVLRRLKLEYLDDSNREAFVTLPWGLRIKVSLNEAIGCHLARYRLYEVGVTETLWRLTDPGDVTIDAGANIGYTASILGIRVGPKGKVICFEPHPQVFESLRENVQIWQKDRRCGSFVLHQAALGAENGRALLHTNDWFRTNRGTAWIDNKVEPTSDLQIIEVPVRNLDSVVGESEKIGVLKVDVQGQELHVLQGMQQALKRHAVRDVIFEELTAFPAPTHQYLKALGYSIFGLQESFTRVHCLPDAQPFADPVIGPIPNYLATVDAKRATARLSASMWRSFGPARFFSVPAL